MEVFVCDSGRHWRKLLAGSEDGVHLALPEKKVVTRQVFAVADEEALICVVKVFAVDAPIAVKVCRGRLRSWWDDARPKFERADVNHAFYVAPIRITTLIVLDRILAIP